MDFNLSEEVKNYQGRIREFVNTKIIPVESLPDAYDEGENISEDYLQPLREQAKSEGLWCIQMPKDRGGGGLKTVGMAACYEEMNRSIFGPVVFNAAAPDDGNMFILNKIGTPEQKERWLQPIIDGEVRSALAMTEPAPGSGSDPLGMMLTTAKKDGNKWIVHGHKWFITGAGVAQHFILLARTSDDPAQGLDSIYVSSRRPRMGACEAHSHYGAGRAWRSLRVEVSWIGNFRQESTDGSWRRDEGCSDSAWNGALDPLYEMAGTMSAST